MFYVFIPPYVVWEGYIGYCMFFCSVKLSSAVAGPIVAKFGMRHEPDARQVLRDFGGATPRDGEIIAQNVLICLSPIGMKFGMSGDQDACQVS